MNRFRNLLTILCSSLLILPVCNASEPSDSLLTWRQREPVPSPIGWAGMVAGVSQGVLITGGGANFPDSPPWAGGKKAWSREIFVLTSPAGTWSKVPARFSQPLGYAMSASDGRHLFMAGGESPLESGTGTRCRDEVLQLEWTGTDVRITSLPSLPVPLTNAGGVLLGTDFYVAGGIRSPSATTAENRCFRLPFAPHGKQEWEELEPVPGPGRMLSVAAALNGAFYLFGGTALSADDEGKPVRTPLVDGYRFEPGTGWKRLADLPAPVTAAPSPAPAFHGKVVLLGGDDGSQMKLPPDRHRGFSSKLLIYSPEQNRFEEAGSFPAPQVTAPIAQWDKSWFLISGEQRPGVRSPAVWQFSTDRAETEK